MGRASASASARPTGSNLSKGQADRQDRGSLLARALRVAATEGRKALLGVVQLVRWMGPGQGLLRSAWSCESLSVGGGRVYCRVLNGDGTDVAGQSSKRKAWLHGDVWTSPWSFCIPGIPIIHLAHCKTIQSTALDVI